MISRRLSARLMVREKRRFKIPIRSADLRPGEVLDQAGEAVDDTGLPVESGCRVDRPETRPQARMRSGSPMARWRLPSIDRAVDLAASYPLKLRQFAPKLAEWGGERSAGCGMRLAPDRTARPNHA